MTMMIKRNFCGLNYFRLNQPAKMSASLWDDLPLASADGLLSTEECFMLLDADFFDNDGWYLCYIVTFQIPVGRLMTPNETPILILVHG